MPNKGARREEDDEDDEEDEDEEGEVDELFNPCHFFFFKQFFSKAEAREFIDKYDEVEKQVLDSMFEEAVDDEGEEDDEDEEDEEDDVDWMDPNTPWKDE